MSQNEPTSLDDLDEILNLTNDYQHPDDFSIDTLSLNDNQGVNQSFAGIPSGSHIGNHPENVHGKCFSTNFIDCVFRINFGK